MLPNNKHLSLNGINAQILKEKNQELVVYQENFLKNIC